MGSWRIYKAAQPGSGGSDPPYTTDIGFLDIPDAVQQCTDLAFGDPGAYDTFDLHFLTSTCTWICVRYYDPNADQSYFDQANSDVAIAYGYSGGEIVPALIGRH